MLKKMTAVVTLLLAVSMLWAGGTVEQQELPENRPVINSTMITSWDKSVDFCIVGYGLAGASAAIQAIDDNPDAEVLILEKMPEVLAGGNSRASGQTVLVPDAKDIDKFKTYISACNEPNPIPEDYLDWWAKEFTTQLPWIESVIDPVGYEIGYVGGGPLRWVKVTEFAELPGSDFNATSAHIRKKGGPGFEVAGVWNGFKAAVDTRDVEIMYESPVVSLVQDTTTLEIKGVVVKKITGEVITVEARKGVLLSCGGFENNLQMQRDLHGMENVFTTGTPGNTGDGMTMLMNAGAQMWHVKNRTQSGGTWIGINTPDYDSVFIRQMVMKSGDWIDINKQSERFYDEARSYHRQHMKYDDAGNYMDVKHWRALPCHMIFDDDCRQAQPIATVWLSWPISVEGYRWSRDNSTELDKGWIVKADTIEELAEKIGRDPEAVKAEIEEWNRMCEEGVDTDWNRDPSKMAKIDTAPYYAVELTPALVATTGGAKRNTCSQVLDWADNPIPRLYEAGELGSYIGNLYQNGCFLAEAIASGRAAAKDVFKLSSLGE